MIWFSAAILLALVLSGIYVASVLGILAYTLSEVFSFFPLMPAFGEIAWSSSTDFVLVAVPLFILMGEIMLRTGIAADMFLALDKWVSWIPGGLMHTNVAASAMFAATSGSSVATAATIGTVAIPNIERGGYNPALFLGSIAAGGTLGILIPPSINMILYGVLAEQSIPTLYLAATIPGFTLAALFSLFIFVACVVKPSLGSERRRATWKERITTLPYLIPPIFLFLVVVGSIYAGWATPTEAASLGVIATIGLGFARRALNLRVFLTAFEGTMKTTAMVALIVTVAFFLNFVLASIGVNSAITQFMKDLPWSPAVSMLMIVVLYLILGMFMETLSLMVATTPIVVPAIMALGYDPVWFGVVFIILIEAALITPPIGMNLFVVQAVRGKGPFRDVALGSVPFVVMMVILILILMAFPELALWLPAAVRGTN